MAAVIGGLAVALWLAAWRRRAQRDLRAGLRGTLGDGPVDVVDSIAQIRDKPRTAPSS